MQDTDAPTPPPAAPGTPATPPAAPGAAAAPRLAPPTSPGPMPTRSRGPTSKSAVASMILGFTGILVPGANIAAIILGIKSLVTINRSDRNLQGRGYSIVGICAGAAGIGSNFFIALIAWTIWMTVQSVGPWQPPNPKLVHAQARQFAERTGAYPTHVSRLLMHQSGPPLRLLVRRRSAAPLLVGDYDVGQFDGSDQQSRALRQAIRALDSSKPWYVFGECRFVRLDKPRESPRLVAAWAPDGAGGIRVAFDDGSEKTIAPDAWDQLWQEDAAERQALGLEAIAVPPLPAQEEAADEEEDGAAAGDDRADPGADDGPEDG